MTEGLGVYKVNVHQSAFLTANNDYQEVPFGSVFEVVKIGNRAFARWNGRLFKTTLKNVKFMVQRGYYIDLNKKENDNGQGSDN